MVTPPVGSGVRGSTRAKRDTVAADPSIATTKASLDAVDCRSPVTAPVDAANVACVIAPANARSARASTVTTKAPGTLEALMRESGFKAPPGFRATVRTIELSADRTRILRETIVHYKPASAAWKPASTVKLYAAVAALERAKELGFSPDVEVTFHYKKRAYTTTLRELVTKSLGPSRNAEHNLLVQLVGYDRLNAAFFSPAKGFEGSAIRFAYSGDKSTRLWNDLGGPNRLNRSPPITLRERGRQVRLEGENGEASGTCRGAVCTSLRDLSECLRRVMLHEKLPPNERFALDNASLALLRQTLSLGGSRGRSTVKPLAEGIGREGVKLYHKPGEAQGWFSNNIFIELPGSSSVYVVTLAAQVKKKKTGELEEAARIIGELIDDGEI
ncbi:MAG: serine hydrolase [Deltaproteobacteria bacterium]|nr:serine hydrolase [Deltaproteobacteria bacterium]